MYIIYTFYKYISYNYFNLLIYNLLKNVYILNNILKDYYKAYNTLLVLYYKDYKEMLRSLYLYKLLVLPCKYFLIILYKLLLILL
jgi:hypothetical protein